MRQQLAGAHPLGRLAEPAEVADFVRYLVEPSSEFVTVALLAIDGGYTAG